MKVYGITNCNTVKKALDWFKANNVAYEFHDFKKLGVSADKLNEWADKAGYEKVMNKQGLTYRGLDEATKASITGAEAALKLFQEKTSIIKRPVIEDGGFLFFGFDEATYATHFLQKR
ncbi:Spx/MgsR family RNA polymerase-binding regulatory protein [Mucilaginibacter myungsuensis]|uniref:Spx/MgsR family RNA polymerase-binding regulatory protein n=1 Tax=Mucilaginibacter myungsuensis TaxID=649104 RepID=A0A929PY29_9SPHI|nr:Spx/MgsR family RNA polymerase-binding regulatory protein [Mucilaginibacter myungsuensis]MBE9663801.1 Spx/MgsR family RNA polymerase-binding regulatory protein [Mucilaginibacter myungsuensis]MDN3598484.1 Spx/MgsR family RNA polymerase-binding regulatory protein [Mucilaginibacter myungsuensis]